MPTYEYACTACGHRLEAVQKFTDDALTECPECGGKLRKVFGAPGIVLKGSGFYKTDTRAQDKRANGSSGSKDTGGSGGSDSSSSDNKSGSSSSSESGTKTDSPASAASTSSGTDKSTKESKPAASSTAS